MTTEPRRPPRLFAAKLRLALGGRAGWGGFVLQLLFVAALFWIGYEIVANVRANLQAQRITSGFAFLGNTAGFDVSQNLIPYSGSDNYRRVFLVGLLNTFVGLHHRHFLRDRDWIYRRIGIRLLAKLVTVTYLRRLYRVDS